jgi:long-chain acyl-CoA synthetase
MAKVDQDGYFYIVDRKKDMIIRGGANIYPAEIEEVLYAHPKIAEAAVVGVADPVFGEQVRAVVALKKGETATKEEILKFCDERLADYKIPKYVEIWAQLPKGPTDKILKRAIREIPLNANP